MNNKFKKKEDEIDLEYIARIYRNRIELGLTNKEVCKVINNELSTDYAESTLRGKADIWNKCLERNLESNNDKEYLKEIEEKTKELQKEKIRFQDQKREYRNYLRLDARFEHLKDEMVKCINNLNYSNPYTNICNTKYNENNEATLILSDIHLGMTIDDYFNKYNEDIAQIRLNFLRDKVIEYCSLNKVNTLHIELLGDLVNGYLHVGNRVNNEEDVISQTMLISEMLADFINNLALKINTINIYSTVGNHGRCSENIKNSLSIENFERLIPWYLESRLKGKNINLIENKLDKEIIVYNVLNTKIFSCHGHKDKTMTIINDLSKMLKIFPDEIHIGHWHKHMSSEDCDIELIVNGSFGGTDDYAESIRKVNKPSQTLIIYDEKGQKCLYKIKL